MERKRGFEKETFEEDTKRKCYVIIFYATITLGITVICLPLMPILKITDRQ